MARQLRWHDLPVGRQEFGRGTLEAVPLSRDATGQAWFTTVKEITDNDYILSANTYSPYNGEEETNHRDPKEILREIEKDEEKLGSALGEIKKII